MLEWMIRRVGNSIVDLVGGLVLVVLILVDGARLDWLVISCLVSIGGCWLVVALVLVVSCWVRLIGGWVVCCKAGVVRRVVTSVVRLVMALVLVVSWWVRLIEGLVVCCKVGVVRWVVTSVVRLVVAWWFTVGGVLSGWVGSSSSSSLMSSIVMSVCSTSVI